MNNIKNNITETGVVETLLVLQKYAEESVLVAELSTYIPISNEEMGNKLDDIATELKNLRKNKLLFLTPEIAVIEKLCNDDSVQEIIICLPSDQDEETYERIVNNKPDGIKISFIKENEVPLDFTANNAAIIAFGFCDGDRALILNYNYRMMEHYKAFYGYKILVSCGGRMSSARPMGWAPINTYEFFNEII